MYTRLGEVPEGRTFDVQLVERTLVEHSLSVAASGNEITNM